MHYLDYNATAPLRPEAAEKLKELEGLPLNASSVHGGGRKARSILEDSRRKLAQMLGAFPAEVIFTASGTEGNNSVLRSHPAESRFVSAAEHASVLNAGAGIRVPVDENGVTRLEDLEKILPLEGGFLLSMMLANNETGVIQPVKEIARLVHARGGFIHTDAVQAFGKIPFDFSDLGVDYLTIAAHKMGGPVGAAALLVRNGSPFLPYLTGGAQESRRRAGTENIAAIAAFIAAAEAVDYAGLQALRLRLDALETACADSAGEAGLSDIIAGKAAPRLPNTSCILLPGVAAETQLIRFDLEHIAVSAGSACSSGRVEVSHVLRAMGMAQDRAASAVRVSGGWNTTQEDLDAFARAWQAMLRQKYGIR